MTTDEYDEEYEDLLGELTAMQAERQLSAEELLFAVFDLMLMEQTGV